jgi:hypothetical protein
MARISKGKFRNLRDHFASQKYFTITKKNIEGMKLMLGDDIKVGEKYIMRDRPMSDEMIKALQAKPTSEALGRIRKNMAEGTKALLERQTRWKE